VAVFAPTSVFDGGVEWRARRSLSLDLGVSFCTAYGSFRSGRLTGVCAEIVSFDPSITVCAGFGIDGS
jgi:hypothetical protein